VVFDVTTQTKEIHLKWTQLVKSYLFKLIVVAPQPN